MSIFERIREAFAGPTTGNSVAIEDLEAANHETYRQLLETESQIREAERGRPSTLATATAEEARELDRQLDELKRDQERLQARHKFLSRQLQRRKADRASGLIHDELEELRQRIEAAEEIQALLDAAGAEVEAAIRAVCEVGMDALRGGRTLKVSREEFGDLPDRWKRFVDGNWGLTGVDFVSEIPKLDGAARVVEATAHD